MLLTSPNLCVGDAQLACPGSNVRQCGQDCLRLRETDGGRCLACDTNCESFYSACMYQPLSQRAKAQPAKADSECM